MVCSLLITASVPTISKKTFACLNDACLVFDGMLVVDATFATNDPAIFAAGTAAKLSRSYDNAHLLLAHYNSREVRRRHCVHYHFHAKLMRQARTATCACCLRTNNSREVRGQRLHRVLCSNGCLVQWRQCRFFQLHGPQLEKCISSPQVAQQLDECLA